ncbi:MAG: TusE/DsrC/DsvC family sulfur relay protein [Gallionella sp.]|nr:TusE/DsrC/DsvC family sulfur relay protein [Gallionella sp.]
MLDINKAISDPRHYAIDPDGNMSDLPPWSPNFANQQAELEGLMLTDEHWEIIYYLRERYRRDGGSDPARDVLRDLESRFCDKRGCSHLYELFPHGPVSQASLLAGLPLPNHAHDISFGSVM